MNEAVLIAIISALGGGGIGVAILGFVKDRKKDNATAKLTDVQALQQQVVLLTQVSDFLRKENTQLRLDYESSEESRRKMRLDMEELESELHEVQRKCDRAIQQLKQMRVGEETNNGN